MLYEEPIKGFQAANPLVKDNLVQVKNDTGFTFDVVPVTDSIVRVRAYSESHIIPPHDNVVLADKDFTGKFNASAAVFDWDRPSGTVTFSNTGGGLKLSVGHPEDTFCLSIEKDGKLLYKDTQGKSYSTNGPGISHYSWHNENNVHLGLGERTAPMDLSYRSFKLHGYDSAFYDAYHGDPLYKLNPFLVSMSKGEGYCIGEFSTSNASGEWSIGSEQDRYWGPYRVLRQDHGGLEKYIIVADSLEDMVAQYAALVGHPLLPSRHFLGYLASGVSYSSSDDPIAQDALVNFTKKCVEEDIPCSAMHLSSGYCMTDEKVGRHVSFYLNERRYPDMKKLMDDMRNAGVPICINVKPFIPTVHKDYDYLKENGALFIDPKTGEPPKIRIFNQNDNEEEPRLNCWIDLSSDVGYKWWKDNIKRFLEMGVDYVWNDNNEFSLINDNYLCKYENVIANYDGPRDIGVTGRMIHTQLMGKSSYEALEDVFPDRRPMIVTRSANVGTSRYTASSWSGDNETSWHNFKGNSIMVLNAGISLLTSYGSDVGGFVGAVPTPELFLRWVQVGIFNPRFSIHSVAAVGEDPTTEPWMYRNVYPHVKKYIKRRYELIPYLYALHWEAHQTGRPLNRWLGWGEFEGDKKLYTREMLECADFWLGDAFLVAGVFEPSQTQRTVYLPQPKSGDCYYYLLSEPGTIYKSGRTVTVGTPFDDIAIFAKSNTAVPIGKPAVTSGTYKNTIKCPEVDNWRGVELYPAPAENSNGQQFEYEWIEDDGESLVPVPSTFKVTVIANKDSIDVKLEKKGDYTPLWDKLDVILPPKESRKVTGAIESSHPMKGRVFTLDL